MSPGRTREWVFRNRRVCFSKLLKKFSFKKWDTPPQSHSDAYLALDWNDWNKDNFRLNPWTTLLLALECLITWTSNQIVIEDFYNYFLSFKILHNIYNHLFEIQACVFIINIRIFFFCIICSLIRFFYRFNVLHLNHT